MPCTLWVSSRRSIADYRIPDVAMTIATCCSLQGFHYLRAISQLAGQGDGPYSAIERPVRKVGAEVKKRGKIILRLGLKYVEIGT